ncbi:MAG: transcriptional regulator [bacterium]|nr:transcriptional regulator [bacterium]
MRKQEEYRAILVMWETITQNKSHIAEDLGIPRGTVKDCIKRYKSVENFDKYLDERKTLGLDNPVEVAIKDLEWRKAYAYLLGTYLGDGCIDLMPNKRTYRMRIAQDKHYTGLIQACVDTINIVLPQNSVSLNSAPGCVQITVYSTHLVQLFPQHGDGVKHNRKLTFDDWQQTIIDEFPLEIFRGLYHSDGSRAQNIVNGTNYVRYMFSNKSVDLIELCKYVCDKIGVHWTTKKAHYRMQSYTVYVSRREDVAYLDEVVGAKY